MQEFKNIGYHLWQMDEQLIKDVEAEVEEIKKTMDFNTPNGLVNHKGFLKRTVPYLERAIGERIKSYNLTYGYPHSLRVLEHGRSLKLDQVWVNWMSKHEYYNMHSHGGVMSWVIWLNIPYTRESELAARPYVPPEVNYAGQFAFHYTNALGQQACEMLNSYKDWRGVLCIFPSALNHSVMPFYSSDELRVSIAGNFFFDLGAEDLVKTRPASKNILG